MSTNLQPGTGQAFVPLAPPVLTDAEKSRTSTTGSFSVRNSTATFFPIRHASEKGNYAFPPLDKRTVKMSFGKRLITAITSRKLKNVIKGLLAFALAYAFVLYSETNTKIQPRTHLNIIIAVLVQNPSQPVGRFVDRALINAVGIGLASACWALVNYASGYSYPWMGAISFICVYFFSIFRAFSLRFFGFGLIGPLFVFTAVASAVGVTGANTSNGDAFDRAFLRDSIYGFLMGFAASLFLNFFLWPEFAERHLLTELSTTFETMQLLTTASSKTFPAIPIQKTSNPDPPSSPNSNFTSKPSGIPLKT
ncbi:hypothetical protein BC829DRAFT_175864 [Chytridium lagenaria]|nr:hypothetical protein BC829DRAFT_175864 [Chytridium lagenaria]